MAGCFRRAAGRRSSGRRRCADQQRRHPEAPGRHRVAAGRGRGRHAGELLRPDANDAGIVAAHS